MSTASEPNDEVNPETLGYMIRDTIRGKSGDYSSFDVNLSDEQMSQFEDGRQLVEENRLDTYAGQSLQVTILNPDGWDALNIDRTAGTFDGDICVGAGDPVDSDGLSYNN